MKPSLSNSLKKSVYFIPKTYTYTNNAKVIQLAEYRHKRKPSIKALKANKYTLIRKNKPSLQSRMRAKLKQHLNKNEILKLAFVCFTLSSLLAIFFFIGRSIVK